MSQTIIAIGASAGGLDAYRQLLAALPRPTGFAFILVQHLEPTHESLLVDLLATHTALVVTQARDGELLTAEHLYIIPPGTALSVRDGRLVVSLPTEPHGARLPFDVLLKSLAAGKAPARAMAVVLSGTGEDGTQGALALRAAGGFVIAQLPAEAAFDGMPSAAIAAGAVDLVLPVAAMPAALLHQSQQPARANGDRLGDIVALLRHKTGTDFTLYKPGTLRRRIERRVGIAGVSGLAGYLSRLEGDADEVTQLAKDLLIHVTGFFRDPEVFALLAEQVIPALLNSHPADRPLRIWVAGCSTGEETWSIAMLFREAISAAGSDIRLQIFASDKDADAVATARQAHYPLSIETAVSAARLARFFTREETDWQVNSDLRSLVVFTVQDVLADPPFSRLDFVSCRNLLIYLKPQAQARVAALFRFALRPGGILLLGGSENLGASAAGFAVLAKSERIWRRDGADGPNSADRAVVPLFTTPRPAMASRAGRMAELCRRLVQQHHAPATVLVDAQGHCLHSLGPTDRYLLHAPGTATQDLLAVARPALRVRLRAALAAAHVAGQGCVRDESTTPHLEIRPVANEGEALFLVSFIEAALVPTPPGRTGKAGERPRIATLERELETTRAELHAAIQDLEHAAEEQRAVNEEALSVSEEYQSTNEELLTSKEELQSLNEELSVLNGQLQETLEHSRTTSDDLRNVLYSTDEATLFLDPQLCIRFFTPATRALFSVLSSDMGRPLADLRSLATDAALLDDAAAVLAGAAPRVQEIVTAGGVWFNRRVLPYRARDSTVAGVVITFVDITARLETKAALREAVLHAEQASAAKSRFLAAASHDLRQPLQTLTLLRDLLAKQVEGEEARTLLAMQEPTLAAMSGMLDTLLDINQIESGTLQAEPVVLPIGPMLDRLRAEFTYLANGHGLALRVAPCGLSIRSDPRLLEQMLRNLLSNALKYTRKGRILIGCRRRGDMLSIEVWDTGIGIPEKDKLVIFDEYHQLENAARERARGLGLGLSIVQRLAGLLGHGLEVHSEPGRGSMFAIAVPLCSSEQAISAPEVPSATPHRTGAILVIEDDPEVRDLLVRVLTDEGHVAIAAADGVAALALIARGAIRPEIILTDFNLPKGMDGLRLGDLLRERLGTAVPVIILTADISTETLRDIAARNWPRLHKPVSAADLSDLMQRLLNDTPDRPKSSGRTTIHVVEDDAEARSVLMRVLERDGQDVIGHGSAEAFLEAYRAGGDACLLVDAQLPGMSGFDLLARLREAGDSLPAIMVTGLSDVGAAVQAMRAGASDFIEKPVRAATLRAALDRALIQSRDVGKLAAWRQKATDSLTSLTTRQREVMTRVLAGEPSKNIAADLGISQRTVETHRAEIMRRTGAKSLPALARLALTAEADTG
ncbi:chemotaxis protein CheB [Falsiroseomonas selenitidurans]|uniref:histidine kinase n=1 Tax=Falsiroseomonas selenitidurans TaxID=2716335 RepID=A0ABX1E8Q1_9PROT|nr:chemotaxis protein CheB [Falsiroseomonas selenitidurans]NKC33590.1 response regulator [Falsiroseomonas selenitidurans]